MNASGQMLGRWVQLPMTPDCAHRPVSTWQYWSEPQVSWLGLQAWLAHAPVVATSVPAAWASHALPYVRPSHPHTGANSRVHTSGRGAHTPAVLLAPQLLGSKSQNEPLPQSIPAEQGRTRTPEDPPDDDEEPATPEDPPPLEPGVPLEDAPTLEAGWEVEPTLLVALAAEELPCLLEDTTALDAGRDEDPVDTPDDARLLLLPTTPELPPPLTVPDELLEDEDVSVPVVPPVQATRPDIIPAANTIPRTRITHLRLHDRWSPRGVLGVAQGAPFGHPVFVHPLNWSGRRCVCRASLLQRRHGSVVIPACPEEQALEHQR